MKAGHEEKYVDGTSAAPWPQLDGVRPRTSLSLIDDRRSEDGEGRGGAKYNNSRGPRENTPYSSSNHNESDIHRVSKNGPTLKRYSSKL